METKRWVNRVLKLQDSMCGLNITSLSIHRLRSSLRGLQSLTVQVPPSVGTRGNTNGPWPRAASLLRSTSLQVTSVCPAMPACAREGSPKPLSKTRILVLCAPSLPCFSFAVPSCLYVEDWEAQNCSPHTLSLPHSLPSYLQLSTAQLLEYPPCVCVRLSAFRLLMSAQRLLSWARKEEKHLGSSDPQDQRGGMACGPSCSHHYLPKHATSPWSTEWSDEPEQSCFCVGDITNETSSENDQPNHQYLQQQQSFAWWKKS